MHTSPATTTGTMPKAGASASSYATDGKCHNSEPGTFGHECGKPAKWIGFNVNGWGSGYCDECRWNGSEARSKIRWEAV